jgi:hypothetical protein
MNISATNDSGRSWWISTNCNNCKSALKVRFYLPDELMLYLIVLADYRSCYIITDGQSLNSCELVVKPETCTFNLLVMQA